jgi:glycosyltransferase involved in cell wall biosynthesis
MSSNRKISLYVPTKDSEATIQACVESILRQALLPDELIIVDASRSRSTDYVIRSTLKDARISWKIMRQRRPGLAAARNIAMRAARYPLVASIDSDCVADRDWLKTLHSALDSHAAVGGRLLEKNHAHVADRWRAAHMRQDWGDKQVVNPRFLSGSNTLMVKKAALLAGYDERYMTNHEDVDISAKLIEKHTIFYEPKAVCWHIRKDTVQSAISNYYRWTRHSYPPTVGSLDLLRDLTIFVPHRAFCLLKDDLLRLRLELVPVDLCFFAFDLASAIRGRNTRQKR